MEDISVGLSEEDDMKHPPYNIRTNKAVDRLLFVDTLRRLYPFPEIENITYYTLGGPFLEDLRVIDHFLPEMELVSLEEDPHTYERQRFNKFSSRIKLENKSLADFLTEDYTNPVTRAVFWLDYTNLNYEQFVEFQTVLTKVPTGSVVRITLRAEAPINLTSLKNNLLPSELDRFRLILEKDFNERFQKLLVEKVEGDTLTKASKIVPLIQSMVQRAASQVMDISGGKTEYAILQSVWYRDPTQMLTVTGIVCERQQTQLIRDKLKSMRFANFDWHDPQRLDIPALTVKERLLLEELLPVPTGQNAGEILFEKLKYEIAENAKQSKDQLAHYADCQRDYPNFIRIYNLS